MVKLAQSILKAFLYDELAAKRWIRGALNFGATILAQIVIDPSWPTWTQRQWFTHALPALVAFMAGSVTAGDKTPENIKALSDAIGKPVDGQ